MVTQEGYVSAVVKQLYHFQQRATHTFFAVFVLRLSSFISTQLSGCQDCVLLGQRDDKQA